MWVSTFNTICILHFVIRRDLVFGSARIHVGVDTDIAVVVDSIESSQLYYCKSYNDTGRLTLKIHESPVTIV